MHINIKKNLKWILLVVCIAVFAIIALNWLNAYSPLIPVVENVPIDTEPIPTTDDSGFLAAILLFVILPFVVLLIYFASKHTPLARTPDKRKLLFEGEKHLRKYGRAFYSSSRECASTEETAFDEKDSAKYMQFEFSGYFAKNIKFPLMIIGYSAYPLSKHNNFDNDAPAHYILVIKPKEKGENRFEIKPQNMSYKEVEKMANDLYYGRIGLPPYPTAVASPLPIGAEKEFLKAYAEEKGIQEAQQ